jgi:class 3 adenylate cyclase/pimeloyl-ACP methyl ester carboxylesterase
MVTQRRLAAILAADVVGFSTLMEADEVGTLGHLKTLRTEVIDPCIAARRGRIVKLMGDGALVEFASAVDAVGCAVEVQQAVSAAQGGIPETRRIAFRIGVNLGDIIVEGEDIYGEGVNIAARLESLCEPDAVYVSGSIFDQVDGKGVCGFDDLGSHAIKNIARPVRVYRARPEPERSDTPTRPEQLHQHIRFCTASDGVRIAYATVGRGAPLVKAAAWMTHLEHDWESPVWNRFLRALAAEHLLVRYDERGTALSDWDVADISFEGFVRDLEAVADAASLDRFDILGFSHGSSVAIAYAVRHPERVRRLVLHGAFARGRSRRGDPVLAEQQEAIRTLIRQGWAQDNPAFRQIFTSQLIPDGNAEQLGWFNDLQRMSTSPENAIRIRDAVNQIDVSELLPRVTQPTLVIHRRGDAAAPFEEGRRIATMIPRARLVALEGRNHVILDHEKEWPVVLEEIRGFLRV